MISNKRFLADGSNQRFLSDFIIPDEQYVRVFNYIYNIMGDPGTIDPDSGLTVRVVNYPQPEDMVFSTEWDLIDNSIKFYDAPYPGSRIYIEVATTPEEFGDTLSLPSWLRAKWYANMAYRWAQEDVGILIDDGEHPPGFSAYHWAKESEEVVTLARYYRRDGTLPLTADFQAGGFSLQDISEINTYGNVYIGDGRFKAQVHSRATDTENAAYVLQNQDGSNRAGLFYDQLYNALRFVVLDPTNPGSISSQFFIHERGVFATSGALYVAKELTTGDTIKIGTDSRGDCNLAVVDYNEQDRKIRYSNARQRFEIKDSTGNTNAIYHEGNLNASVFEPADPAIQAHLADFNNPHGTTKAHVGLGNVEDIAPLDMPISTDVQNELDVRFTKFDHTEKGGSSHAFDPVTLNNQGMIDATMLDASYSFYLVDGFTPASGAEYPDDTGYTPGAFWLVEQLVSPYTFTSGDLNGQEANNGDLMIIGMDGWVLKEAQLANPTLYMRLDKSISLDNNSVPLDVYGTVSNIEEGAVSTDAASYGQLTTHTSNTSNPHAITASQVGAEPSDPAIQAHLTNTINPHSVDKAQVGLDYVTDTGDGSMFLSDDGTYKLSTAPGFDMVNEQYLTGQLGDGTPQELLGVDTMNVVNVGNNTSMSGLVGARGIWDFDNDITVRGQLVWTVDNFSPDDYALEVDLIAHTSNQNNPHNTDKTDVGLGFIVDTGDGNGFLTNAGTYEQISQTFALPNNVYMTAETTAGTEIRVVGMDPYNELHIGNVDTGNGVVNGDGTWNFEGRPYVGTEQFAYLSELADFQTQLDNHVGDNNNPHNVTAAQIGAAPTSHVSDNSNPHNVTYSQTGAASSNHNHDGEYLPIDGMDDYVLRSGDTMTGDLNMTGGGNIIVNDGDIILKLANSVSTPGVVVTHPDGHSGNWGQAVHFKINAASTNMAYVGGGGASSALSDTFVALGYGSSGGNNAVQLARFEYGFPGLYGTDSRLLLLDVKFECERIQVTNSPTTSNAANAHIIGSGDSGLLHISTSAKQYTTEQTVAVDSSVIETIPVKVLLHDDGTTYTGIQDDDLYAIRPSLSNNDKEGGMNTNELISLLVDKVQKLEQRLVALGG